MEQPSPVASSSAQSSLGAASSSTRSPVGSSAAAVPFAPSPRPIAPTQPGRPILKKPPPPPRSFFSLSTFSNSLPGPLSRFIPSSPSNPSSSTSHAQGSPFVTPQPPPRADYSGITSQPSPLLPSAVPYGDDDHDTTKNSSEPKSRMTSSANTDSTAPVDPTLKRVHFILPHLSTVYPFSSNSPPSSNELTAARAEIDARVQVQRQKERDEGAGAWSLGRIEDFYRECCRLRDEQPLGGVVGALRQANIIAPRTLDLTAVKLTVDAAAALADALAIEWGLRKLILRDCDLDSTRLKHILHALLIPSALASLSLSSNRRMKQSAFKLVGAYISASDTLEFIDLSQNSLDKRAIEYIVQSIRPAPPSEGKSSSPNGISHRGFSAPHPTLDRADLLIFLTDSNRSNVTPEAGSPIASPIYTSISSPSTYFPPLLSEMVAKQAAIGSPTSRAGPEWALGEKVKIPLLSLRLDECTLKGGALDALAHSIRTSAIQHLSLRGNKMGPPGAVALALMIRDYPDSVPLASSPPPSAFSYTSSGFNSPSQPSFDIPSGTRTPSLGSIRSSLSALGTMATSGTGSGTSTPSTLPSPPATPPSRSLSLAIPPSAPTDHPTPLPLPLPLPPPRHPGTINAKSVTSPPQPVVATTYTPYIPRSKRNAMTANPVVSPRPASASAPTSPPIFQSSRAGGVTARLASPFAPALHPGAARPGSASGKLGLDVRLPSASGRAGGQQQKPGVLDSHSAALLDNIRSLDNLPRLGSLTTLDLRGNDLRSGVQYIAQVLKRNRTLKVLSLADNRIDVPGFVYIAEALKYNSTLETLDMSNNNCCGPTLEGVTSLRTAFTINTALKRLYLSSTGLTSAGAIALAEFLPDARCLFHLDLTHNKLDFAGVLALSTGLKVNRVLRCLDVNVPPNDPEMARLSREILRCCVRNTEVVANGKTPSAIGDDKEKGASSLSMSKDLDLLFGSGTRGGVWGLIERSELARGVRQDVERERVGLERQAMNNLGGKVQLEIWRKTPEELVKMARELLKEAQGSTEAVDSELLLSRTQVLVSSVAEIVQIEKDPSRLEELLELNDRLNGLIKDLKSGRAPYGGERSGALRRNSKGKEKATESAVLDFPQPSFSITSSDDEADQNESIQRASSLDRLVLTHSSLAEEPQATTLSRSWVEEEGEVFRKGHALLGPQELGEEGAGIDSEELKRELLEAQVERKPRHDEHEDGTANA